MTSKCAPKKQILHADKITCWKGTLEKGSIFFVEGAIQVQIGTIDLNIDQIVHGQPGLFQSLIYGLKYLSSLHFRIGRSFANGRVDAQVTADIECVAKLKARTERKFGDGLSTHRCGLLCKGECRTYTC